VCVCVRIGVCSAFLVTLTKQHRNVHNTHIYNTHNQHVNTHTHPPTHTHTSHITHRTHTIHHTSHTHTHVNTHTLHTSHTHHTQGVECTTRSGHFAIRAKDLMCCPTLDADAAITIGLKNISTTSQYPVLDIQCALLYVYLCIVCCFVVFMHTHTYIHTHTYTYIHAHAIH